jgi:cardiolipin synthase
MELPPLQAMLFTVVQLALSLGITVDALLRKRNVAAATAWIGLVWLSPIMGSVLYLVLGINRVTRRAARLRRRRQGTTRQGDPTKSEAMAPLDIAITRITGRQALKGNEITLLEHGDAAYPRMLEAIAQARTSIAMASYIFRDDEVGRRFIDALADAHDRGVQVRVLIDGVGGGYLLGPAWRALHRRGVPAARFLHSSLPWRTPLLNLRLHTKMLVIDGVHGFTGGLNITADSLLAAKPAEPVRDTHFAVSGPVTAQMMVAFERDWHFTTDEHLRDPWFPDIPETDGDVARVVTSGPDQELERIKTVILSAIGAATRCIHVATPYFLPDESMATALELAALRGVSVNITMPGRSDHFMVDWSSRAGMPPLLSAGVTIRLSDPPFDHSKLMTVDGMWCLVGSANWDMRSLRLNFETCMEVRSEKLAAQIEALIAARPGHVLTAAVLKRRKLPIRLRDAATRLLLPYL